MFMNWTCSSKSNGPTHSEHPDFYNIGYKFRILQFCHNKIIYTLLIYVLILLLRLHIFINLLHLKLNPQIQVIFLFAFFLKVFLKMFIIPLYALNFVRKGTVVKNNEA